MYKLIQRIEGRYYDLMSADWSTYKSASTCVSWQRKLESEKVLDPDKVQLACVPAERLQEFLTNPAASVMSIPVTDLTVENTLSWHDYVGMGITATLVVGLTAVLLWGIVMGLAWMRGH